MLTQPLSNYKFNPDECWNNLITIESGIGDINIDNDITISDVVLLQKYLVAKDFFNKAECKLADMNSDGKVNVFDLIILKRKILNS